VLSLVFGRMRHESARVLTSALAVGAAVGLVLVFQGFRTGLYQQMRELPESLPADLVVLQAGVENIAGARSTLAPTTRQDVEGVPGVGAVHPLAGTPLIFSRDGLTTPIYVVAYDTAGGPTELEEGHLPRAAGEVIVDRALAHDHGLATGDTVEVVGATFTVAGVAPPNASMWTPIVYVRYGDLIDAWVAGDLPEELAGDISLLSFLLVDAAAGVEPSVLRASLEAALPDIDVMTPAELGQSDLATGRRMMDPVLDLLVGIAVVTGVLVVGLTLFSSVVGRQRELAVMKALGTSSRRLALQLGLEALVLVVLALVIGAALAAGTAEAVHLASPGQTVTPLEPGNLWRTAISVAGMAVLGSLAPLWRLARVDPATAFSG